jgi:hypothetical protein
VLDYGHVNDASSFSSAGQAKKSLGCCHAMQTYLHWLDTTIAVRPDCGV